MIRKQPQPHRLSNISQGSKLNPLLRSSNSTIDPTLPQEDNQSASNTNTTTSPMVSSVAKVVQPTATVSSFPVSGPSMSKLFNDSYTYLQI